MTHNQSWTIPNFISQIFSATKFSFSRCRKTLERLLPPQAFKSFGQNQRKAEEPFELLRLGRWSEAAAIVLVTKWSSLSRFKEEKQSKRLKLEFGTRFGLSSTLEDSSDESLQ